MSIQERFAAIANEYIDMFCEKQGLHFDGWVNNDVGEVALFNSGYYIMFDTIRLDIDKSAPMGEILKWYDLTYDGPFKEVEWFNYNTYLMGYRGKDNADKP